MKIMGDYRIAIFVIELETTEYVHDCSEPENSVLVDGLTRTIAIYSEKKIAEHDFENFNIYDLYSIYELPNIGEATLRLYYYNLIPDAGAQFEGVIEEKNLLENIDWEEVNEYINKGK